MAGNVYCMVVELRLQYYCKKANSIFKNQNRLSILKEWFWESVLSKLSNDDHKKMLQKSKLVSCLGTGWENKN